MSGRITVRLCQFQYQCVSLCCMPYYYMLPIYYMINLVQVCMFYSSEFYEPETNRNPGHLEPEGIILAINEH